MIPTVISGLDGAQAASAKSKTNAMGKDEFLTLLVAQLKNQDPLSPMDNTDFTSQMAQFSSLEQLFNVNDNLLGLQTISSSANNTQALALIGKEVEAQGDMIYLRDGSTPTVGFNLSEDAVDVKVHIMDASGKVVRSIYGGSMQAGQQTVTWDGRSNAGGSLDAGVYTYVIDAVNVSGDQVEADTFTRGLVSAVSMDNGVVYVHIGEARLMLNEITEVRMPAATTGI